VDNPVDTVDIETITVQIPNYAESLHICVRYGTNINYLNLY